MPVGLNLSPQNKRTLTVAGVTGGLMGAASSFCEYSYQKDILANPKKYFDYFENLKASAKTIKDKDIKKAAIEGLNQAIEETRAFVREGKLDIGSIVKKGAANVAKGAILVTGIFLLVNAVKGGISKLKSAKGENAKTAHQGRS